MTGVEEVVDAWVDGTEWLVGRKGAVGETEAEESDDGGSERIADMYATEASNCRRAWMLWALSRMILVLTSRN